MDVHRVTDEYETWLSDHVRLVKSGLRKKHEDMGKGAFVFLRATFYLWVKRWRGTCPELARAPEVLAIGDLHVENFGTWRDGEGRLVWGVNDFDEAHPAAYTQDLVRLATSAILAARHGHLAIRGKDICDAIRDGYREGLKKGGRPFVLAEEHGWLRDVATAVERDPANFWEKLQSSPRHQGDVPAEAVKAIEELLPERGINYECRARVAGVGSLGLPRFVALAAWRGGLVAREAKALVPSALAWISGGKEKSRYPKILRRAVRSGDPFVRPTRHWLIRRLAPDCCRIELEQLPRRRDEAALLAAMGQETANIHLGSAAGARRVPQHLAAQPRDWLHDAASRMAVAVAADAAAWKGARGRTARLAREPASKVLRRVPQFVDN